MLERYLCRWKWDGTFKNFKYRRVSTKWELYSFCRQRVCAVSSLAGVFFMMSRGEARLQTHVALLNVHVSARQLQLGVIYGTIWFTQPPVKESPWGPSVRDDLNPKKTKGANVTKNISPTDMLKCSRNSKSHRLAHVVDDLITFPQIWCRGWQKLLDFHHWAVMRHLMAMIIWLQPFHCGNQYIRMGEVYTHSSPRLFSQLARLFLNHNYPPIPSPLLANFHISDFIPCLSTLVHVHSPIQ